MQDRLLLPLSQPRSSQPMLVLSGVVERVIYQDEIAGYTVARLLPEAMLEKRGDAPSVDQPALRAARGNDHQVVIDGSLVGIVPGEALELTGLWERHPKHGWHFKVFNYRSVLPATLQGIRKYLGSGLIQGIGPQTAERIVARFGMDTFVVLDQNPTRLHEVSGLGMNRVQRIVAAWEEQKAIKAILLCLQEVGISTSLAVRMYQQYRDDTVRVIRNEPYRLAREVPGIGFKTADVVARTLGYAHDHPERIKAGTLHALSEVSNDEGHTLLPRPRLIKKASDLLGVSAEGVDEAIDDLLLEQDVQVEIQTMRSGGQQQLIPFLSSAWLPLKSLPDEEEREEHLCCGKHKDADEELLVESIAADSPVQLGEELVSLRPFCSAERGIAWHIRRLATLSPQRGRLAELQQVNFSHLFEFLAAKTSLALTEQQREGIRMALTHPVCVLTGGPGTGKTTSMRALIQILTLKQKQVILAAPTGKAAKRLSEAAGVEARTLHRLLQLKPGGTSSYDQSNPLFGDMVIIDESSMLDTLLMNALLKALSTGTHLLLVGDADQLPSIGPGTVLADIIKSQVVPVVRLESIFRQGAGSGIANNALRINQGLLPLAGKDVTDYYFFPQEDPVEASNLVIDLVTRRIPAKFGLRPQEIQVLSPMYSGRCGVGELNKRLQATLNPSSSQKVEKYYGGLIFRLGDKVLQLRNNYQKEVFNGDTGSITAIMLEDQRLTVQLDEGREVSYNWSELDELTLAYALSVHKAQGSEYPVCVIPLVMEHYPLLERQLIYTAITRARKVMVLVGSKKAVAIAVRNGPSNCDKVGNRSTESQDSIHPSSFPPRRFRGRYTGLAIRLSQLAGSSRWLDITS